MELEDAVRAASRTHDGVLVTLRQDGRPQLSNINHLVGADGLIRISITADRAKYANLRRRPWAALKVDVPNFWSYAVIEGEVTLSEVATRPDDEAVAELIDLYRGVGGEHPDWDDYRRAMVADRRVVVRIAPGYAYGMLRD